MKYNCNKKFYRDIHKILKQKFEKQNFVQT